MTILNALLISTTFVTVFGLFAIFMIREEPGYRKAKPYFILFYLLCFVSFYLVSQIPYYETLSEAYLLDFVLYISTAVLTVAVCIRCRKKQLELTAYTVAGFYLILILLFESFDSSGILFSTINIVIIAIAIFTKLPKANVADYGLVVTLLMWLPLSLQEISYSDSVVNFETYFNHILIVQLVLVPAMICGVSIFTVTSYMIDSNLLLGHIATRDPLTDLLNRRALFEQISLQESYLKRIEGPAALLLADIDHFKNINDTYGHEVGDITIKHFSDLLIRSVREYDIVARYGGEEFIVFLPESSLEKALQVAERIRVAAENEKLKLSNQDFCYTVSIGVASYNFEDGADATIALADKALYRAKSEGRNRVCTLPPPT